MNDDPLNDRLGEWRLDAKLPDSFRSEVWRRIERLEHRPVAVYDPRAVFGWLHAHGGIAASVGIMLLALGGFGAGLSFGQVDHSARIEGIRSEYQQAINPLSPTRMAVRP